MGERQFIIDSFRKNFSQFEKEKIAIYGLGKNTKAILEECQEFHIAGLMDGLRTGEVVWGYPVITCEEAAALGVKAIVIIATSANVPIIYRRIAKQCIEFSIPVFDINGEQQEQSEKEYELPNLYKRMKKDLLIKKIDSCDVVSFDIFDTLLVRKTLQPADIFENLQCKYKKILPAGFDFVRSRMKAERELYLSTNPTIYEIYQMMVSAYEFPADLAEEMVSLEIEEEIASLHVRNTMVDVLDYAVAKGKIVCCTSDMYLPKEILERILEHQGIVGLADIFVSCDYRKNKCEGLFQVLKERFRGKRILHVGDNKEADVYAATRYGIEDVFEIASVYNMALASRFSYILDLASSLDDRNTLGEFLSYQLNDPFLFHDTEGKLIIDDCYSLGHFFLEPIIETFTYWMIEHAERDQIDCLLLGSRDGWLIRELLDIFKEKHELNFEYKYFYVSREACTAAGVKTEADIKYAASLAFDGTMEEMLEKRFLLKSSEIKKRNGKEHDQAYLAKHYDAIYNMVKAHKQNYGTYISSCGIIGEKLGFVDFVSSGTCQFWLEKIMETELTGFYFVRNLKESKNHLKIHSLIKPSYPYERQSKLYQNYIFLESVLTSPEPMLKGFDTKGNCIFGQDNRTGEQITSLLEIHNGIKDTFRDRCEHRRAISIGLAENMLDLIRPEYAIVKMDFVRNNVLVEEFCNRTFDLQEVLGMDS